MMNQPIAIVIHSTGRHHYVSFAIEEIAKRTYIPYRLFVVSCGDGEGIPELLAEMVQDHYLEAAILVSEGAHCDQNQIAAVLAGSEYLIQATDEWIPPRACEDWPWRLVESLNSHPYYGSVALKPSFFPSGMPPLMPAKGGLLTAAWLEPSFRIVRLNEAPWSWQRLQGYIPDVVAEYLPQMCLGMLGFQQV